MEYRGPLIDIFVAVAENFFQDFLDGEKCLCAGKLLVS